MATVKDTKRVSNGVVYRGKKYPGFNKPKRNSGSSKHKMEVLAKKGNEIKVVRFGHKDYGHNYSSKARDNYLKRSAESRTNLVGLRRMISSLQTTGREKYYGQAKAERKKVPKIYLR